MRILHTADWHLNHRLGRLSLREDLEKAVILIANYLEEHKVDVLIIAGDLFWGREGREQLKDSIAFLSKTFEPFRKRGGTVLAISGNHDSEPFFETLRDAFTLVTTTKPDEAGVHPGGRFYLAPNPRVVTLRDSAGEVVQFVLMPYPTPRAYLEGEQLKYANIEERNRKMLETYRQRFQHLEEKQVKKNLPAVLVAHAQVRGISENELFQPSDKDDVILDSTDLPDHYQYSAYGHIHRSQAVTPGSKHQNYAGSLLPLDAGEKDQVKSVWLFDIKDRKRFGDPKCIPLPGPPLYDLIISPEEIDGLAVKYPDASTALVKYTLRLDPSIHPDPFVLHERIRDIFRRWYDSENEIIGISTQGISDFEPLQRNDVPATVLEYLRTVATYETDFDKTEVINLAEQLLTDDAFTARWRG
jgi:exonuclease SbcD